MRENAPVTWSEKTPSSHLVLCKKHLHPLLIRHTRLLSTIQSPPGVLWHKGALAYTHVALYGTLRFLSYLTILSLIMLLLLLTTHVNCHQSSHFCLTRHYIKGKFHHHGNRHMLHQYTRRTVGMIPLTTDLSPSLLSHANLLNTLSIAKSLII